MSEYVEALDGGPGSVPDEFFNELPAPPPGQLPNQTYDQYTGTQGVKTSRSKIIKSRVWMRIPKGYEARNVYTKLDDLGLYSDTLRHAGESVINFKNRLIKSQSMRGGSDIQRLTDAICNELYLDQASVMSVRAKVENVVLNVTASNIQIITAGVPTTYDLLDSDVDGYWKSKTITSLVTELNTNSSITATATAGYENIPAVLLEPQTSIVRVDHEQVPIAQAFSLGIMEYGTPIQGPLISGSVVFTNEDTFHTQVNSSPSAPGQWAVSVSGRIQSFSLPDNMARVSYQYSLLGAGMSMNLVANGARIINLASEEIQNKLFTTSGIGVMGKLIVEEARLKDRLFWGR